MDVFIQTVRKEGALALYKGGVYASTLCVYLTLLYSLRDAFTTPGNRGRKFPPVCFLRLGKASRNSVRRVITPTNGPRWRYGRCCKLSAR